MAAGLEQVAAWERLEQVLSRPFLVEFFGAALDGQHLRESEGNRERKIR
jgi:hypothetical protein